MAEILNFPTMEEKEVIEVLASKILIQVKMTQKGRYSPAHFRKLKKVKFEFPGNPKTHTFF